jgi:hypothetical protein
VRQLGLALGVAALGAILQARMGAGIETAPSRAADSYDRLFTSALDMVVLVGSGVMAVAALSALALIRSSDLRPAPVAAASIAPGLAPSFGRGDRALAKPSQEPAVSSAIGTKTNFDAPAAMKRSMSRPVARAPIATVSARTSGGARRSWPTIPEAARSFSEAAAKSVVP